MGCGAVCYTRLMSAASGAKVLLVSPPWQAPHSSSLALGTLGPILEREGLPSDTLYGSVLFPYTDTEVGFLDLYAAHLFGAELHGAEPEQVADAVLAHHLDDKNLGGILFSPAEATLGRLHVDERLLRRRVLEDLGRARVCVARCVERASSDEYDVVMLSVTFDVQIPAAIAIARQLRRCRPGVRIAVGGAACFEEQGVGVLASFACVDAVCISEGERVVGPLARALRGERPLAEVPGIVYRLADGSHRCTEAPPVTENLDSLPVPEYGDYLHQLARSEWASSVRPRLFFEASRGCWWGQKHLCTFCGLNAEGLAFRRKSAGRVYDEIRELFARYPEIDGLQATDNILDMSYFQSVLPRLAAVAGRDRSRRLFFEVKSNLRKHQVAALARAGVTHVQPGIESFSDEILALMRKGATGIGQIQFVKWAHELGVQSVYNIIIRNPGERATSYRDMTALVPYIEHLPPPTSLTPMLLNRFSPYHSAPEERGIRRMRPRFTYAAIYRSVVVDLARIAYHFDFDHDMLEDEELGAAHRDFIHRVWQWIAGWQPRALFGREVAGGVAVWDFRGETRRGHAITGRAAGVFRLLDAARGRRAIARKHPELHEDVVEALLQTWLHRRWAWHDARERWLVVVPQVEQPAQPPLQAA